VAAHVGDVLRIVNDDTVPHRLHTDGAPFPHRTADIPPSQSADYVLQAPVQPGDGHVPYDHDIGRSGGFGSPSDPKPRFRAWEGRDEATLRAVFSCDDVGGDDGLGGG
jgi:hypothetical protein